MKMTTETKHIPQFKLEEVKELKDLITNYDVICLARMNKLGASQLQSIRKKLAGKIIIRMAKNRLFKIAAIKTKKSNIKDFINVIEGSTSFIFTKMNPFKLQFFLTENKVHAPAKVGDIAPKDITIPEGSTGFPPGPMISEFKKVGIDTLVKQGSIYIKQDTVVAKKGEEISRILALVLSRMNITPMEIGLNLYAAYDNGVLIKSEDLDINVNKIMDQIQLALSNALSLSLEIAYPTKENINFLVQKAYLNAKSLILLANIITPDTISDIIAKAQVTALSLSDMILSVDPNALPSEVKQKIKKKEEKSEPKETKKKEEKPEEKSGDMGLGSLFG